MWERKRVLAEGRRREAVYALKAEELELARIDAKIWDLKEKDADADSGPAIEPADAPAAPYLD